MSKREITNSEWVAFQALEKVAAIFRARVQDVKWNHEDSGASVSLTRIFKGKASILSYSNSSTSPIEVELVGCHGRFKPLRVKIERLGPEAETVEINLREGRNPRNHLSLFQELQRAANAAELALNEIEAIFGNLRPHHPVLTPCWVRVKGGDPMVLWRPDGTYTVIVPLETLDGLPIATADGQDYIPQWSTDYWIEAVVVEGTGFPRFRAVRVVVNWEVTRRFNWQEGRWQEELSGES